MPIILNIRIIENVYKVRYYVNININIIHTIYSCFLSLCQSIMLCLCQDYVKYFRA